MKIISTGESTPREREIEAAPVAAMEGIIREVCRVQERIQASVDVIAAILKEGRIHDTI